MIGSFAPHLPPNKRDDRDRERNRMKRIEGIKPVPFALVQEISSAPWRSRANHPEIVNRRRLAGQVSDMEDLPPTVAPGRARNSDRNVDVEDPVPAVVVGQPAANRWTNGRASTATMP